MPPEKSFPALRQTLLAAGIFLLSVPAARAIDLNGNQLSDVWERVYDAAALSASGDADGDGRSNGDESIEGTDPFDPNSRLAIDFSRGANGVISLSYPEPNPKAYEVYHCADLAAGEWLLQATVITGEPFNFSQYDGGEAGYYRVQVAEVDTDSDGVSDWEEAHFGFDPETAHTDRERQTDLQRVTDALGAANRLSLHVIDGETWENWPDPAVLVLRRSGGLDPVTVQLAYSGTANATDYSGPGTTIVLPAGRGETYLSFTPVDDGPGESMETLTVTLLDGADYTVGSSSSGTIEIHDTGAGVSPKEAARLLAQAGFGATLPEIAEVQSLGIEGWIDAQLALPPTLLQTATEAVQAIDEADEAVNFYSQSKLVGWWGNAMDAPDQLRQRMAYALSQIIVVSDKAGLIDGEPVGMAHFYDILVRHAFGNYHDILTEVTYHPVMGIYLSHKGNRAPDPSIGRFPDENYAREIMQLFTIGLWMLHSDGTRVLDEQDEPVPTYGNFEISELARVFTGMNWGTNDPLVWWTYSTYPYESELDPYTQPMQFWEGRAIDEENGEWLPYQQWIDGVRTEYFIRDKGSKQLVTGVTVPAGQLGGEDVALALETLFNHPNVGPFLSRLLIQRLVKSNPTPAYVGRVAAVFDDNGSGVRGDLGAVAKAILMDAEARDYATLSDPAAGKQREPYLRLVAFARSFGAHSTSGLYPILWREDDFLQQPMSSPTVFNFYRPDFAPPGPVKDFGLVAPEFQITTSVSTMTVPNHFYWPTYGTLGWFDEPYGVTLDYTTELALADDPDALLAHLDLLLTYGALSPAQQGIIRYALQRRIDRNRSATDIVGLAVYLLLTSPEYVIQK